ncbi:MAG TPA: glycoside hydrolase family 15 protein [Stellaceae bacterium]|nr:glycoside hydrolase family 15 protein [Stellaceae bacterium]
MSEGRPPFIPYPQVARMAVVGDRRTAAIVAADGTIGWWCLPNYDGTPVCGALLAADRGGFFRLGPREVRFGVQSYIEDTACLTTLWERNGSRLELTDFMMSPETNRPSHLQGRRTLLRRLRCVAGRMDCTLAIAPRRNFEPPEGLSGGAFRFGDGLRIGWWSSIPVEEIPERLCAEFTLAAGEEVWVVLGLGETQEEWSTKRAAEALAATIEYWRSWGAHFNVCGARAAQIKRSALLVHLLCYAPTGAPIGSPTSSLPERIGGGRNFDYRYSWIRDASLSIALLSELGLTGDEMRYLDWLCGLPPGKKMPLQTVYRADGETKAPVEQRDDLNGYRGSLPVRFGNPAFEMTEMDSFGYLADCIWIYLQQRGHWQDGYWQLVRRIADFTARRWRERGTGIWELKPQYFVTTRVLSWVALDRAVKIAEKLERGDAPVAHWRAQMDAIRNEVMDRGWCAQMNSFRQHYDADTVDAALLLIPLFGFLPADDPRVEGTVTAIENRLMINGFVYRFVERDFPEQGDQPLGEEEGAFVMCTCWLAHYYALRGDRERADAILCRVDAAASAGCLAEAIDGRSGELLGNMPLLFSQAEYAKAAMAINCPTEGEG